MKINIKKLSNYQIKIYKKRFKISLLLLSFGTTSFITGSFLATKNFNKKNQYIKILSTALTEMNNENYSESRRLYTESLKFKEDSTVLTKIKELEDIEISMKYLTEAQSLYEDSQFKESLNKLNSITTDSFIVKDKIYLTKLKIYNELENNNNLDLIPDFNEPSVKDNIYVSDDNHHSR